MTTTAGDQINGALRLIGQLAEGETPSAATSQDALTAMNQMLDSWSSERLSVFSTQDQVFTWPANTATRTLGPTGNFVGNRPVLGGRLDILLSTTGNNISFGIKLINQQQYNGIAVKTVTSTYPQVHVGKHGNVGYRDDCVPGANYGVGMAHYQRHELVEPATLATSLVIPPGYLRAFPVQSGVRDCRRVWRRAAALKCSGLQCRANATLNASITPTT
jgi:hypothetical protein